MKTLQTILKEHESIERQINDLKYPLNDDDRAELRSIYADQSSLEQDINAMLKKRGRCV